MAWAMNNFKLNLNDNKRLVILALVTELETFTQDLYDKDIPCTTSDTCQCLILIWLNLKELPPNPVLALIATYLG